MEKVNTKKNEEILEKYDAESRYRQFDGVFWRWVVYILAIGLASYHLISAYTSFLDAMRNRALHTAVITALVFLLYPPFRKASRKKVPWYDILFALLALTTAIYIFIDYDGIINRMFIFTPNTADLFLSAILILLVLEGGRRVTGLALTSLCVLFLIYAFYGDLFPGIFKHSGKPLDELLSYLYLTTEGIYGTAIAVSASYIILFILFGAFLNASGMGKFFNDISLGLAGHTSGGPAKVAVLSSGFLGSINGSALANVVTTGAFTIPMMKRVGYRANFAGAVEAAASVGGQIIPPVMGAVAFIMAETLGMPYSQIALAAIMPALLYYLGIILIVHFRAKRRGFIGLPKEELPNVKDILKKQGHLLIPIIVLIYLLFSGKTPIFSALMAIILSVVVSQVNKSTRMGIKDILIAMENGVRSALGVAMSCAMVGIIVGVTTLTGLGGKLTQSILILGQDSLFLTLFFTMIACIIMGMGLPSIPTYIITSSMAAPALLQMGVPVFVSHMFVFYFGILANISPPVALAAFAAAGIADGNPNKTGIQALRLAAAGFIVPYVFAYSPELIMMSDNIFIIIWVSLTSILGVICLSAALEGYFKTLLSRSLRIVAATAAITLIVPETFSDIIGICLFSVIMIQQFIKPVINSEKNTVSH